MTLEDDDRIICTTKKKTIRNAYKQELFVQNVRIRIRYTVNVVLCRLRACALEYVV